MPPSEAFQHILINATPDPDVDARLRRAFDLAARFSSEVTGACFAWPASEIREALIGNALSNQHRMTELGDAISLTEVVRDDESRRVGITPKWRCGVNHPEDTLIELALLADLVVTSTPEASAYANVDPATIARRSGAAVLRLGCTPQADLFHHVVLAWKDTREAHCALVAALPILRIAKLVTVVGIGDEAATERLEEVVSYLTSHGVPAQSRHLPARGSVGRGLLDFLEQNDYPLVVAGARGHGLWTERLFGGMTQDLLSARDISWLMAT